MEIIAFCILLSVVAVASLNASSSIVPVNESTSIVSSTNTTWPPLPFIYPITKSLYISIIRYGELSPLPLEEVVLAALVGIENDITSRGYPEDDLQPTIINQGPVLVSFQCPIEPTMPLRLWEAAGVVNTISRLMYVYEPRELSQVRVISGEEVISILRVLILNQSVEVSPSRLSLACCSSNHTYPNLIAGSNDSPKWPPEPFTFPIQGSMNLQMTIFKYGPNFTESKDDVLRGLLEVGNVILQRGYHDTNLPDARISYRPIAATFNKVRFPELPLTGLQAFQVIHKLWQLTVTYGPIQIITAEINEIGRRAMLLSLGPFERPGSQETSFLTLSPPLNELVPVTPALIARSNMTSSNTTSTNDKDWPPLPNTYNIEEHLYMTILDYGVYFPGRRRDIVQALRTIATIIKSRGQPGDIFRAKPLSVSPVRVVFSHIVVPVAGASLTRAQAAMVVGAMEALMEEHKPREITRAEIYVDGVKVMRIFLEAFFAPVDTGNAIVDMGNAIIELGNTTVYTESATLDAGAS